MDNEDKARRRAEYMRNYRAKRKEKRTEKENEEQLKKDRERKREERDGESDQEKLCRLEALRLHAQEVREGESEKERLRRLEAVRVHVQDVREDESEEERSQRLEAVRIHTQGVRESESIEERQRRLEALRLHAQDVREVESHAERQRRLEAVRLHTQEVREGESEEERLRRLEAVRLHTQYVREWESEVEHLGRLEAVRLHTQEVREKESEEERLQRLETVRHRAQEVRDEETEEIRLRRQDADRTRTNDARNVERLRRQERPYVARNAATDVTEYLLGPMCVNCSICHALHFEQERNARKQFVTCCQGGQVVVPNGVEYPELLHALLSSKDDESKHFMSQIRKYNSMFAFASFGSNGEYLKLNKGPKPYVIHGQVYHCTAKDFNQDADTPVYSNLYILDPDFANRTRALNPLNKDCKEQLINTIGKLLQDINPYAQALKMMKNVIEEHGCDKIQMFMVKDTCYDQRRYNMPLAKNEIAAVFASGDGCPELKRDICVHPKGTGALQNIMTINPNCDPMTYPILFPFGDQGWSIDLQRNSNGKRQRISLQEFYSFKIQDRTGIFNPILHAGRLTQQYIVDAFLKVEEERLNWVKMNQKALRVESYLGLMDYIASKAEGQNLRPGKMVILPSSFTGSKRYMTQAYQDAMTVVAVFGKPDLFITFTCNPKWKEIQDSFSPGEQYSDRPDIVATVFRLKLKHFLEDVLKKNVLGKVKAFQYVIEFQKRGLPHCHMLFILESEDKIRDCEDIDSIVSAEIPDKNEDPALFTAISTSMMHGPCGEAHKDSPCMEERKGKLECTKGFPKPYCKATNVARSGYPEYMRSDNGRTVSKGKNELSNNWVVPYNPYLSKKYNAHINVEVCSTIKSVKYIYKYVYKGHDAAIVEMNKDDEGGTLNWDEIRFYMDARYVGAPESMWRLREYPLQDRSHSIIRLAIHLPLQQRVLFDVLESDEEDTAINKALESAEKKGTTLTTWFKLNKQDPDARRYLYREIPHHYVFDKNTWKKRQRGHEKIISRMYSVNHKDMELYSLKLLLLHIAGAQSYVDLRTVEGITYPTFKEAAHAMNLLEDDVNWVNTLQEAVGYQMPSQLRMLFGTILTHGKPSDPRSLYTQFLEFMVEDFLQIYQEEVAVDKFLVQLDQYLTQYGESNLHYGLPAPHYLEGIAEDGVANPNNEERDKADTLVAMLNEDQRFAYDNIMDSIDGSSPMKIFVLSGAGGTGKTFVYNAVISTILGRGQIYRAVAPTGLAATLLKNGRTVHSGFGLPLNIDEKTFSWYRHGSTEHVLLKQTKVIIWDEISMCSANMLQAVDRSLRDLLNKRGDDTPFGGITFVAGGDFRQQAPVIKRSNRLKTIESCVKSSNIWRKFKELKLNRNMRVQEDEVVFASWLEKVGDGLDSDGRQTEFVGLEEGMLSSDIVKSVFGENISELSPDDLASRAILCPLNDDTLKINECILRELAEDTKSYYSTDSVTDCETEEEQNMYPVEFLNTLTPSGMPPHVLNLKLKSCVMLLRNLNPQEGLCNGTRLIVERLDANLIHCRIFTGDKKGSIVFIPRLELDTQDNDVPFRLKRKQFPLRLAYSMTITKSQGQTFEKIGVYLRQPVFAHGQLYTAFSRVKSSGGLKIAIEEGRGQGKIFENDPKLYTHNVVYRELL